MEFCRTTSLVQRGYKLDETKEGLVCQECRRAHMPFKTMFCGVSFLTTKVTSSRPGSFVT